jgi:hypothetical protein
MIAVSDRIAEKAATLVSENRVVLMPISNTEWLNQDEAFVAGHTSAHRVIANNDGVWCDCRAWRPNRLCSHAVSAMALWASEIAAGVVGATAGSDAAKAAGPRGTPPESRVPRGHPPIERTL